jgi:lipopolysaccharide export system protein LptA
MLIPRTITLLLLLLPAQLWALANDRDQPIEVEADSLELGESENISIYQGNVKLVQGSLEISADRLVIHFNDNNDLTLMEMIGAPATLRQLDDERQEMRGQATQINYLETESVLELLGQARFIHGGDIIESDKIRINTENNAIQAGSSEPDQRVKMLIQPRKKATPPE